MRSCGRRERRQRASEVTSNRVSGSPTGPTNRRMGPVSGLLVPCLLGCKLRMSASQESRRAGAVATCCWLGSRPTWACVPECTFGSEWIGTLRIPRVHRSCQSGVTSVSESRNSFECIFEERRNDEQEKLRATCSARIDGWPDGTGANQAYRNAGRRHDLKFLSIRGETTPRAPVW